MKNEQPRKYAQRIAVFGLGRFGFGLAVRLSELGAEVLAVDSHSDLVEEVDQRVARAVCLDATNEFAIAKLDLAAMDLAIVSASKKYGSGPLTRTRPRSSKRWASAGSSASKRRWHARSPRRS